MDDLTKALLSFALGAVGGYIALVSKVRKDLEAAYDKDLRTDRLEAYKDLWTLLERLAKYAPLGPVTGAVLKDVSEKLRHWYFTVGGLYLTDDTRDAYFALQEALVAFVSKCTNMSADLAAEEFETIRQKGSWLRTWMTRDVGTRKRSMIDGERLA
jgi:hypothetical protein